MKTCAVEGCGRAHVNGRTQSVIEWARELGLSNELIFYRLRAGLPLNLVLSKKKVPRSLRQKTYADSAVLESLT